MDIIASTGTLADQSVDTYLVFVMRDSLAEDRDDTFHDMNAMTGGQLQTIVNAGEFEGEQESVLVIYLQNKDVSAARMIVVGLGSRDRFTPDVAKRCVAVGMQKARGAKSKSIATQLIERDSLTVIDSARAIAEGALLGLYQYHGQKTTAAPEDIIETLMITVDEQNLSEVEAGIATGIAFAEGAKLTRDLVNLPPNICTPDYMGRAAIEMAEQVGLNCDVLGKQQMEALKMGAHLAVARGSDTPPRFIVMEHNADKSADYQTVVLIGKGVTFDTGGYSLKSRDGMVTMKGDMGGGGAVIGAMKTIAMLKLPIHVVGLVPAADNRVSGDAYLPQEVITASNGKTIEIISTDAEGRLLLADALVYAKRFEPDVVIDIATLTGSSMVALGGQASSLFCTDDDIAHQLQDAGETMRERVWRMPLYEEYFKAIESDTADMRNSAGRTSGVGSAAIFLKQFVEFESWAHIDMAGLGSNAPAQNNPYVTGKTATGYGARLMSEFVRQLSSK